MSNNVVEDMKTCKYCQSTIPKKARICPNCRKKQKGKVGIIILGVVILLIIIGSLGSGGDKAEIDNSNSSNSIDSEKKNDDAKNAEKNDEINENEQQEAEETDEAVVLPGGNFEANGLKVTVNDAVMNYELQDNDYGFYDLDDGLVYAAVSFTFENTGDTDSYVSIYDFDCYADNSSCEQKFVSDGGDFINTNLSSGRNVSFMTFYAVPENAETIELEYTANIWTDEKVIVKIK